MNESHRVHFIASARRNSNKKIIYTCNSLRRSQNKSDQPKKLSAKMVNEQVSSSKCQCKLIFTKSDNERYYCLETPISMCSCEFVDRKLLIQTKERMKELLINGNEKASKIKLEINAMIREKYNHIERIPTSILEEQAEQLRNYKNQLVDSAESLEDMVCYLKLNNYKMGQFCAGQLNQKKLYFDIDMTLDCLFYAFDNSNLYDVFKESCEDYDVVNIQLDYCKEPLKMTSVKARV